MTGIRTGVTEPFAAVGAFKRFFAGVDANVFLQVMLELEGFHAFGTLELAQFVGFVVGNHMALESVDIGERLRTHFAHLKKSC